MSFFHMEVLAEATSAAVAAATSALVVYPLDTVLVRFQATSKRKLADPYADASSHGLWHRDLVNIVLDLIREPKTAKSVGGSLKASSTDADEVISKVLAAVRKAYKGVGVKVVEAVVRNFVYFIWYAMHPRVYIELAISGVYVWLTSGVGSLE